MLPGRSLKSFRLLLLPISWLYWLVIAIRNWLFDKKILRSSSFGLPIICVGNIAVGGTGKSPMVEYLLELLGNRYRVATLSRGYKRRTRGYALAGPNSTALEIGDEPMQFYLKYPHIPVAVGEERVAAVPQLLHDHPETQAIILDDAFQHRSIRAGLNILLTDYNNLFTGDRYLPAGTLRDLKSNYKKAEVLVVTKCPEDLQKDAANTTRALIKPEPAQQLYFTTFVHGTPFHLLNGEKTDVTRETTTLLVTGIANPQSLETMLAKTAGTVQVMRYNDHHIYTIDDLKSIRKKWNAMKGERKMIITTEKDAVRLVKFRADLADLPFYIMPVKHQFLFNEGQAFNTTVETFINEFKLSK